MLIWFIRMTDVMCCQVGTLVDLAGYWPTTPIKDLFPDLAEDEEALLIQSELKTFIYASKQHFTQVVYISEKIFIFSCTIFDVKSFHLNC